MSITPKQPCHYKVGGPALTAALNTYPCPQSTREHSLSNLLTIQSCRCDGGKSSPSVVVESVLNMRLKRNPSKNSYFSTRPLSHFQILLVILFIFISWACYKETHKQDGKPVTQLNTQGSSWQQPKLTSSGTMKYLWLWSCHCLGVL